MNGPSARGADRSTVIAADIGRTTCRVTRFDGPQRGRSTSTPCGWSLADRGGSERIAEVLAGAAHEVLEVDQRPAVIGVGTTGAMQAPDAADDLAARLVRQLAPDEVVVTSDVVSAHVGALAGEPGVTTIAGSGAVALAVSGTGTTHVVDGAGWLLGDAGGGVQIGRAGLAAAVRWHDGRDGGSQRLAAVAGERFGPLEGLAERVQGDPRPARLLASFVPDVAVVAREGEATATAIFADAVEELVITSLAAAGRFDGPGPPVLTVVGGLFDLDDLVAAPWSAAIAHRLPQAEVRQPVGDAIDGVHRLAVHGSRRHQHLVHRRSADRRDTEPAVGQPRPATYGEARPKER